jgi:hypothetical protein
MTVLARDELRRLAHPLERVLLLLSNWAHGCLELLLNELDLGVGAEQDLAVEVGHFIRSGLAATSKDKSTGGSKEAIVHADDYHLESRWSQPESVAPWRLSDNATIDHKVIDMLPGGTSEIRSDTDVRTPLDKSGAGSDCSSRKYSPSSKQSSRADGLHPRSAIDLEAARTDRYCIECRAPI